MTMKIFGKEIKGRDLAKAGVEVVAMGVGACSAFAVKKILGPYIPKTGQKWADVAMTVGIAGITTMIETKVVQSHKDEWCEVVDVVFNAIEKTDEVEDASVAGESQTMQVISFENREVAEYVLEESRKQLERNGFVSLWYMINLLDEDAVSTEVSKEESKAMGWTDLSSAYICAPDELPEGQRYGEYNLLLPQCVRHVPVPEKIVRYDADGNKSHIITNGVR